MFVKKIFFFARNIMLNMYGRKKISLTCRIYPGSVLNGPVKIGCNTIFNGQIDSYSYIGSNCIINARIGKFCSISPNVKVISATHPLHYVSTSPVFFSPEKQCNASFSKSKRFDDELFVDKENGISCCIGNDVWIGENVLIKGGVSIGDGSCIAMGAVVVSDVPPYSIVGGVPAKVIRKRFSDEIIDKIIKSDWWNKDTEWLKLHSDKFTDVEEFIKMCEK